MRWSNSSGLTDITIFDVPVQKSGIQMMTKVEEPSFPVFGKEHMKGQTEKTELSILSVLI